MPMDKMGRPRSGMARMGFADKAHGQHTGSEKGSEPAKESKPPAAPSKKEEGEANAGMATHIEHRMEGGAHNLSIHGGAHEGEHQHDNIHSAHLHAHEAFGHPHPEESAHSIEDHVAEHGPAHHAVMHHDKESGAVHVTTHHGEKNAAHHSKHASHAEAAEHMDNAFGSGDSENEEHEESPFKGTQSDEEEALEDQVTGGRAHRGMGLS